MAVDDKDGEPTRRNWRPPIWMALLVLLLLGVALFGDRGVIKTFRMLQYKQQLQEKLQKLEADNEALRHEIELLRKDQRYLEGLARKELGMVKEDELIYQFPSTSRNPAQKNTSAPAEGGNP